MPCTSSSSHFWLLTPFGVQTDHDPFYTRQLLISFREWMRVYKLKGEAGKSAVIGERFDPNEGSLGDGSEIPF